MTNLDSWLEHDLPGWSSGVTTGAVKVHCSGQSAFESLGAALDRCDNDRAVIAISAWSFSNVPTTSFGFTFDLLKRAAAKGAHIRVMFAAEVLIRILTWTFETGTSDNNEKHNTKFIDSLPGAASLNDKFVLFHPGVLGAILPRRFQVGMHHMKAWTVYDGRVLTAWIGGMDINSNRTALQDSNNYWHDVHAEVTGPLADSVYRILRERWNSHPKSPPGTAMPELERSKPVLGRQRGRIVTTFGNPRSWAGVGDPQSEAGYAFAPGGSSAYREAVRHCISQARRFIYIEDQYMVHEDIARDLGRALEVIQALIILIPVNEGRVINPPERHPDGLTIVSGVAGELKQAWERRKRFLSHLSQHREKVAIVTRDRYVHSKTWIFDDTIAITGSANLNRRGYAHDTEGGIMFGDESGSSEVTALRYRLWKMHLGPLAPAVTVPGELALPIWQAAPAATKVRRYDPDAGRDTAISPVYIPFAKDWLWDNVIDPDCP